MIVGETISHYRVLKLLGAGGMGEVYQAEDTRLKRTVALKFLPLSLVQDRDAKERLVHEAQAASALDHPNICTIHEIDETPDGRVFLAMAYYEGETLKERIARSRIAADEALDIIVTIGRAVRAAHEAGIIHRDIKPANVMLTTRGEVKLLDFGIAKLSGQTALTRTGTTVGTVAYMAPEQIAGHGADERSDLWALGVVLYEMLAGRPPFAGANELAVVRAIADADPPPLRTLRPDVPTEIESIVAKALQKDKVARYRSAHEFLQPIEALRAPAAVTTGVESTAKRERRSLGLGVLAGAAMVLIAALSVSGWFVYRGARVRSEKQTLQRIVDLVQHERYWDAYVLFRQREQELSRDPDFANVRDSFMATVSIQTNPPGADVYLKPYFDAAAEWMYFGRSPIEVPGPLGYYRWRVTKPGFAPFEGAAGFLGGELRFSLAPEAAVPAGMVAVRGGPVDAGESTLRIPDFFIGRFEVTNREFKKFVDAGGYRTPAFWINAFVKDGRTMSWNEAMAEFRDATGRPGPATWELGTFPEGQDDYPVRGVSWYEAAAFARFAGQSLPTVHHWRRAAVFGGNSSILELSNFAGKAAARVGEFQGLGPFGTYDMAGNVKEWCWNAVDDRRYILGGAWNEPNYQYRDTDARVPFDRSSNDGFRLIALADPAALTDALLKPVERLARDYVAERPVADDVYRTYASLYNYDATELQPVVESTDVSSPSWRMERITFAAPYGGERIIAYLFLPKNAAAPYQTVVYFPHNGALVLPSFDKSEMSYLGFLVKAGRAFMVPMYKGTYERRLSPPPVGPNAIRDVTIQQMKDLRRSIDYLDTRSDIDSRRVAYFGISLGARLGSIALAVENRLKAGVLYSGGLPLTRQLPEIDEINFAPRVTAPVLLLSGRDDFMFPFRTSQLPLLQRLGTPSADKRRIEYEGGHQIPFTRTVKDTLEWLDRYLGVPK